MQHPETFIQVVDQMIGDDEWLGDWSFNAGILRTLWGSTPRVAYFAMKGDKKFNIG